MTHGGWVETISSWSAMGYRRWLWTAFKWILWEHHNKINNKNCYTSNVSYCDSP